jgi:hypothetical protein
VRGNHIGADSIERGFQNLLRRVEGEATSFFSRDAAIRPPAKPLASIFLGVSAILKTPMGLATASAQAFSKWSGSDWLCKSQSGPLIHSPHRREFVSLLVSDACAALSPRGSRVRAFRGGWRARGRAPACGSARPGHRIQRPTAEPLSRPGASTLPNCPFRARRRHS